MSRRVRLPDKPDANTRAIVEQLRDIGADVEYIHRPVDLLIGFRGQNYLVEIKSVAGQLTPEQERFLRGWRGQAFVASSLDEIMDKLLRKCR